MSIKAYLEHEARPVDGLSVFHPNDVVAFDSKSLAESFTLFIGILVFRTELRLERPLKAELEIRSN